MAMRLSEQRIFVEEAKKDLEVAYATRPFDASAVMAARHHFHASQELYENMCVERAEALEGEVRELKRLNSEMTKELADIADALKEAGAVTYHKSEGYPPMTLVEQVRDLGYQVFGMTRRGDMFKAEYEFAERYRQDIIKMLGLTGNPHWGDIATVIGARLGKGGAAPC